MRGKRKSGSRESANPRSANGVAHTLTYALGKVCPKCGDPRPDQRTYCLPCHTAYGREYYARNHERMAEYQKRYNRQHRSRNRPPPDPPAPPSTNQSIPEYTYFELGLATIGCDVVRHGHSPEGVLQDLGDIRAAITERTGARFIDFDSLHVDNYPSQDEYQWYPEDEPPYPITPKVRRFRAWDLRRSSPSEPPRPPVIRAASPERYDTWWNFWEDSTD